MGVKIRTDSDILTHKRARAHTHAHIHTHTQNGLPMTYKYRNTLPCWLIVCVKASKKKNYFYEETFWVGLSFCRLREWNSDFSPQSWSPRTKSYLLEIVYGQIARNRERCKVNETSYPSAGLEFNFSPVFLSTHSYFALQSVNVIFSLYYSVNTGVDSVYNRSEYQEYFLGVEAAGVYARQPCNLHVPPEGSGVWGSQSMPA